MLFFFLVPYLNSFLPPPPSQKPSLARIMRTRGFALVGMLLPHCRRNPLVRPPFQPLPPTVEPHTVTFSFWGLSFDPPPFPPPTRSHFLPILCPIRFRKRACGGWPLALTWNSPSRTLKTHRHLSDKICVVCSCCFFFCALSPLVVLVWEKVTNGRTSHVCVGVVTRLYVCLCVSTHTTTVRQQPCVWMSSVPSMVAW